MGSTIWVCSKSAELDGSSCPDDLPAFYEHMDELDALADSLGTRRLTDFLDTSEVEADFLDDGEEDAEAPEGAWFTPADALPALQQITERARAGAIAGISEDNRGDLIEDLEECLREVRAADEKKDLFRFSMVM